MTQSTSKWSRKTGLHVAIIMDGNGRWAVERGKPRVWGHRAGARAVRCAVEAAPELGVSVLTLYAFSSDNWKRPKTEVAALMTMFHDYLVKRSNECLEKGVRISVIGRRDRLDPGLVSAIQKTESATAFCRTLHLRLAVDYSARDAILAAAMRSGGKNALSREAFSGLLAEAINDRGPAADVDLLIRTGGEQRLSDFLLWEAAYAELVFTNKKWPDFDASDFASAIELFHSRQRRFGGIPAAETRFQIQLSQQPLESSETA